MGDIVSDVPGGSANRPSSVTQIRRFCLDFGVSPESFVQFIAPKKPHNSSQFQSHLISISYVVDLMNYSSININRGIEKKEALTLMFRLKRKVT